MKVTRKAGKIDVLKQAIRGLGRAKGEVGWFESARYEGGQPVAGVAAVQEFGNAHIPPRSFMRSTAAEKSQEWVQKTAPVVRAVATGQLAPDKAMDAVCLAAEGDVRAKITEILDPPLADATVAARKRRLANGGRGAKKGIQKPLVDKGILLATLTSQVTS